MRTRLLAFALCALALAAARPGPARAADAEPRIAYHAFTLDNGLRVFVVEDHTTPTLAIVTYYKVGSKDELPGKTGFAHLFEHLMFKGSAHVVDGLIDVLFEGAGGWTNAFTSGDQTVYLDLSSSAFLEPALWLEADRMAGLTETIDQPKLDNQRDVVRNERRQSYENRPYGKAELKLSEALWPKGHGYHWSTIGYHEDLLAASVDDVKSFFANYYVPNNAVMVIVGDVDAKQTEALVRKYLGWIPRGAEPKRPVYKDPKPINKEIRLTEKDAVQVPRVYLVWRGPKVWAADEAALDVTGDLLGNGKSSRLWKRLVVEDRIAQDVEVFLDRGELGATFYVVATAKPGVAAAKLEQALDQELARLAKDGPTDVELERVKNSHESSFLGKLEDLMDRGVLLATYVAQLGDADYLAKDLAGYRAVTAKDVKTVMKKWLHPKCRVVMTVVPEGK